MSFGLSTNQHILPTPAGSLPARDMEAESIAPRGRPVAVTSYLAPGEGGAVAAKDRTVSGQIPGTKHLVSGRESHHFAECENSNAQIREPREDVNSKKKHAPADGVRENTETQAALGQDKQDLSERSRGAIPKQRQASVPGGGRPGNRALESVERSFR